MELSCQLGRRAAVLRADWIPRLQNEEADALTNGDFRHFEPSRRIEVDLAKLDFIALEGLFAEGEAYITELAEVKEKAKLAASVGDTDQKRKKTRAERDWGKKGRTLRERDPW